MASTGKTDETCAPVHKPLSTEYLASVRLHRRIVSAANQVPVQSTVGGKPSAVHVDSCGCREKTPNP